MGEFVAEAVVLAGSRLHGHEVYPAHGSGRNCHSDSGVKRRAARNPKARSTAMSVMMPQKEPQVSTSQNKELSRRWFEEVWNKRRSETIDEMFAADRIAHGLGSV